ncbi:hypothetical protein [Spirosoma profusum]|uniref:hypothetical protein n=1 Tax=Spirosoma profusum TaxID=2771354 RepID=UPI001CC24359|nr:hypothetical protein [Spirosoma profusum]
MTGDVTVLISWLAWFVLLYQVYLQRTHNEKSLKPLGQIDFRDRPDQLYIRVSNNGVGPMIVDRLHFSKYGKLYATIEDCLELDKRSYARLDGSESVQKVILPNSSLTIFEASLAPQENETAFNRIRDQLSSITLTVKFHDIYDNKMTIERDFHWFSRHLLKETVER